MRKYGNEEKLGRRKPVEPLLQLHMVVVVAFDVEVCPSIVQKFALRLCRSLPDDRAFRLTVSSLLASMMPRPIIDLTIDLTKADSPSDSDDPGAVVDRGSSSDSCICQCDVSEEGGEFI